MSPIANLTAAEFHGWCNDAEAMDVQIIVPSKNEKSPRRNAKGITRRDPCGSVWFMWADVKAVNQTKEPNNLPSSFCLLSKTEAKKKQMQDNFLFTPVKKSL